MDRISTYIYEAVPGHISRSKNVMTLASMKQWVEETLGKFLKRFNAAAIAIDKPDPSMVLMTPVSGIEAKMNFKVALERDPPRDVVKFYHEAERFLCQEDAEVDEE